MSITFTVRGQRLSPKTGDRFVEDLRRHDQNAYRIGTLGTKLEPIYQGEVVDLEAYLDHSAEGPCWEAYSDTWCLCVAPEGSELNLSSVNAEELLGLLGLDRIAGEVRGSSLVELCDFASQSQTIDRDDSAGRLGLIEGNSVQFPRRPGYIRDRLSALRAIAVSAGDLGVVSWG